MTLRIAMTLAVPDLTGASRMLFYYANALKKRGHNVLVLHGAAPKNEKGETTSIVTELQQSDVETHCCPLLRRPIPPFVYSQVAKAISSCDAIVGVNQRDRAVALAVAQKLDVPGILAIQNQHNFWGPLFVPQLKKIYYASNLRKRAARLVCTSQATMDEVAAFGVPKDKCTLLKNGISVPPAFEPSEKLKYRSKLDLKGKRLYVNVGRLDIQKGQDLLVEAWSRRENPSKDDLLWLVGDITEGNQAVRSTNFKNALLKQIRDLKVQDSVQLLGWRSDVPEILRAADYYVHSARWEGYPLAVMEAMAANLPVVMTDCSGHPEGFENGVHGYVVSAGKIHDSERERGLIYALECLQDHDETTRLEMGRACRKYCEEHYDIEIVGEKFAQIVETEIQNWKLKT